MNTLTKKVIHVHTLLAVIEAFYARGFLIVSQSQTLMRDHRFLTLQTTRLKQHKFDSFTFTESVTGHNILSYAEIT